MPPRSVRTGATCWPSGPPASRASTTVVYVALTQTTAANALLALALVPATILVGSALIGASRPTPLQWGGSALSLAGAAVLVTRADPDVLRTLAVNLGDLWMLGAVVIWSAYTLLLKRRPAALPPTVTLAASMGFGLALMLPLFLLLLPQAHLEVGPGLGWALAYIVVFPSVLAFWLRGHGVARLGPERAGQFVNLMPVFGPALAMAILGERIISAQLAGAALVFAGVAAVVLGRQK